jgi:hypothetical protein
LQKLYEQVKLLHLLHVYAKAPNGMGWDKKIIPWEN